MDVFVMLNNILDSNFRNTADHSLMKNFESTVMEVDSVKHKL
jgi:hypothetical protein